MKIALLTISLALSLGLIWGKGEKGGGASEQQTVRFWYHLDDPETALNPLITKFEQENPGITIKAERIAWDSYYQKLLTSIAGGDPPDVAQVKLWWQPQLVSAGALLPLDDYLASWPGRDDIYPKIWKLTRYQDGHQYYMPLQMVILYLYYRKDMFDELGLSPPTTREEFLSTARALTRDLDGDGQTDVYGFGIRGARGGHDYWATFVLSSGARFFNDDGSMGLTTPQAISANQWFIDLYSKYHVSPPTTPSDGFKEVIANMISGKTAMTIHHIGSAPSLRKALGDKISAAPVPRGTEGYWTSFGDEENAVFSSTQVPDAAFAWAAFLAEAENNALWQKSSGQVSVNKSNAPPADTDDPFLLATTMSTKYADVLPAHPRTAEFVETLWPPLMQQAFAGKITSKEMMQAIEDFFQQKN